MVLSLACLFGLFAREYVRIFVFIGPQVSSRSKKKFWFMKKIEKDKAKTSGTFLVGKKRSA